MARHKVQDRDFLDYLEVILITLPMPPKELSPNARVHWTKKSRAVKSYRAMAYFETLRVKGNINPEILCGGQIVMSLMFYPVTKRKRDDDNLIASFKSARDGIAEALGVDDSMIKIKMVNVSYDDKTLEGNVVVALVGNHG